MGNTDRREMWKDIMGTLLIAVAVAALYLQYQQGGLSPDQITNALEAIIEGLRAILEDPS